MMTINFNEEKNGIEVSFQEKPEQSIIDGLKAHGFRWSRPQKLWYARQSDERAAFVRSIDDGAVVAVPRGETPQESPVFDLWALTRTEDIPNFYTAEHLHDRKEIARRVRTHLKSRFPMVKISVTKDDFAGGGSIDGRIKAAPWAKDSEEMQSILNYCDKYLNAFNYDNSDSYSDYWDVNFYDSFQTNYDYEQTAYKDADKISDLFRQKKEEAEEQERIAEQKRFEEYEKQAAIDAENSRIAEEKRNKALALLEERKVVKPVDFWVTNALDCGLKCCGIDEVATEVKNNGNDYRRNVHVKSAVYLNDEDYATIASNLMSDYSFCSGHGGTGTDDFRVNSMEDYSRMTPEERESVEWYIEDAIAIYRDDTLMFIANPEGYGYIRYALILDDESRVVDDYHGSTGISEDEAETYNRDAAFLAEVIESWPPEDPGIKADHLREWCHETHFKLTPDIIRALPEGEVKTCAYAAYYSIKHIQEQFREVDLKRGQRITIIKNGMMGTPSIIPATVDHVEYGKYAQYNDCATIIMKPKSKRTLYQMRVYTDDTVIYDGWLEEPPEGLFFEIAKTGTGWVSKMTKFASFDKGILETTLDYYGKQGHEPMVNTFNNRF